MTLIYSVKIYMTLNYDIDIKNLKCIRHYG